MWRTRYSSQVVITLESSRQVFEKYSNIKFHENPSSGSQVVPCGRTGITKLTATFRNTANASKTVRNQIHLRNQFHVRCNRITAQGKMLRSQSAVRTRLKRSELRTGFSESQCNDRQDQNSTVIGTIMFMYYGYNIRNQVEIQKKTWDTQNHS